jgi:hypothetical protein
MTMSKNQGNKWENLTLDLLETRLRHLPTADVPESLKARLFATIPDSKKGGTREYRVQWWPRIWRVGAAAAAVFAVVLILTSDYRSFMSPRSFITNLREKPVRYLLADQNNKTIVDTNYVDFNSGL